MSGVWTLNKVSSGAISQGTAVYANGSNDITATDTVNTFVGYAAADGATSINVLLAH